MERKLDGTENTETNESGMQFQDAESLIRHMKNELKNGKHIPLGVPYDQEIVDSFSVERGVFDRVLIEKKAKNPKKYYFHIFVNADNRKLIIESLGASYPDYIAPIPEVEKEDIKDFETYISEIRTNPFGGVWSTKYEQEISLESAQILLEQIVDLTTGNNPLDEWLDS